MRFELTDDQQLIEDQIRQFMKTEIAPYVADWDKKEQFQDAALAAVAELGMLGMNIPEEFDGAEADPITLIRVLTEMAKVDASLAAMVALQNAFVIPHLLLLGDPSLAERFLPQMALGELQGAWIAPSSGFDGDSDSFSLQISSDEKGFFLDGSIPHLFMAEQAAFFVGFTRSNEGEWFAFWLENKAEGLTISPRFGSLGLRGAGLARMDFEQVRLAPEQVRQGANLKEIWERIWRRGRLALAALSAGIARGALEEAIEYAKQRHQFGKPLAAFQAIQWKISDIAMQLDATALVIDRAAEAWERDDELIFDHFAKMARFMAGDLAVKAAQEAIQIHGGYGFTQEFPVERFYRDAQTVRSHWGGVDVERHLLAYDWFHLTDFADLSAF